MAELIKVLDQEPAPCLVAPACGMCFASVGLPELRFSSMWGNFHTFFRLSFVTHSIALEQGLLGNEKIVKSVHIAGIKYTGNSRAVTMPKLNIQFLLPAPANPSKHSSNSLDSYTVSITSVVVDDD